MKRILVCAMMVATFLTMLNACGQNSEDKWQEQYDLGVRYLSEGNYEEAIIAFTAAIEIDAQRPEGYHSLADVYVARGDIGAAITTLNQGFEETGDSSIIDRLVELENEQSPILTEEGKRNLAWAYNLLEANDYTALCQQGNQLYIDRQYTFPFDDYIGLCFDGAGLHRSFDGIGMKIIDSRHWYFGQLVSGEPEGIGVSYCYRPQVESNGTLFYELYEGEWRNGKANGDGVFTNMIGNTAGEQTSAISAYREIQDTIYYGLSSQWQNIEYNSIGEANLDISYLWYRFPGQTLSNSGYLIDDLNGDHIPELIISTADAMESGYAVGMIYDLYTYQITIGGVPFYNLDLSEVQTLLSTTDRGDSSLSEIKDIDGNIVGKSYSVAHDGYVSVACEQFVESSTINELHYYGYYNGEFIEVETEIRGITAGDTLNEVLEMIGVNPEGARVLSELGRSIIIGDERLLEGGYGWIECTDETTSVDGVTGVMIYISMDNVQCQLDFIYGRLAILSCYSY